MAAHDEALRYGGRPGVANLSLVESAIARPYCGYFESPSDKCAALLHGVVSNHGFADANKRTAWLLTELFIEQCGLALQIPDDAPVDDIVVAVADKSMSFDDLRDWFDQNLRANEL